MLAFFITSLAQTQTATQAFGIMQAWEIVGVNAQKFYLLTFATQTASLLNVANVPITGLIAATNAQGQAVNINTITIQTTTPPNCTDFDALRTRANTLPAPMNVVDINLAITKLCTVTDKTGVNAKLVSYSNTEIKSFLNQIKLTGQGARHISNHINATFGVPQVEAWKKLYTSGFETDFEYIRTLVYVGVNACTVTITPNVTKSVTVTHNNLETTFINEDINAQAASFTGEINSLASTNSQTNKILNIVPLIRDATYVVTRATSIAYVTYKTDTAGRVKEIIADLIPQIIPLSSRKRDNYQQQESKNVKDGVTSTPVDHGGHMVASLFDGPVEQINYFPQRANINTGTWKSRENHWAANLGQGVSINIKPQFIGASKKPDRFFVEYSFGGVPQVVPANTTLPIPPNQIGSLIFIIPNP